MKYQVSITSKIFSRNTKSKQEEKLPFKGIFTTEAYNNSALVSSSNRTLCLLIDVYEIKRITDHYKNDGNTAEDVYLFMEKVVKPVCPNL